MKEISAVELERVLVEALYSPLEGGNIHGNSTYHGALLERVRSAVLPLLARAQAFDEVLSDLTESNDHDDTEGWTLLTVALDRHLVALGLKAPPPPPPPPPTPEELRRQDLARFGLPDDATDEQLSKARVERAEDFEKRIQAFGSLLANIPQ